MAQRVKKYKSTISYLQETYFKCNNISKFKIKDGNKFMKQTLTEGKAILTSEKEISEHKKLPDTEEDII